MKRERVRDISYCASDCANRACERNYSPDLKAADEQMWGANPPVNFADHRAGCAEYMAPSLGRAADAEFS